MHQLRTAILIAGLAAGLPLLAEGRQTAATTSASAPASVSPSLSLATVHGIYGSSITATGRVQALTSARVGPRVSGRIAEFAAVDGQPLDVGMSVKKGQTLFSLELTTFKNRVALAEAQHASAQATLANLTAPTRQEKMEQLKQEVAQMDVRLTDKLRERDRYKRLVEQEKTLPPRRLEEVEVDVASLTAQKKAAEARFNEAQNGPTPTEIAVAAARVKEAEAALAIAQKDLADATVTAPFDGVITQRFKSVGDYLVDMPPTEVLELVSADRLEAEVAVPESYLPAIKSGASRLTLISPLLRQPLQAPVSRIVGQVDAARGTFAVRVAIPAEKRELLMPGAFITAELPLPETGGGVIAPARAITLQGSKAYVFVAENGVMQRREVQPGDRLSEGVVVQGLKDGQTVVIGPAAELADGKALPEYLK